MLTHLDYEEQESIKPEFDYGTSFQELLAMKVANPGYEKTMIGSPRTGVGCRRWLSHPHLGIPKRYGIALLGRFSGQELTGNGPC